MMVLFTLNPNAFAYIINKNDVNVSNVWMFTEQIDKNIKDKFSLTVLFCWFLLSFLIDTTAQCGPSPP